LVVFLLLVSQSSDVLQYVFGKLFGRHKIVPEISPSKTIEGFAGGVVAATLFGVGLWRLTPFNPWQAAGMALTITLMGFFGGLVMSAIKRDQGVKDWGRLIAGHGGMLDRLDSLAFSAPIFFHLTRYFFAS
jgi:phosphatidate cytidylyltransferase